jgi:hypothetical protein
LETVSISDENFWISAENHVRAIIVVGNSFREYANL